MSTTADRAPSPGSGRLPDGAANALLLDPPSESPAPECTELLAPSSPVDRNVLYVTLDGTPRDRMAAWRSHVGEALPSRMGFVDVAPSGPGDADAGLPGSVSVETVPDPGDLTGISMKLNAYRSAWDGDDDRTAVCFRSLTTLLQHVDVRRAFRFLHQLAGRMRRDGALAHYHVDPNAVDPGEFNALASVCDAAVEPAGGGGR